MNKEWPMNLWALLQDDGKGTTEDRKERLRKAWDYLVPLAEMFDSPGWKIWRAHMEWLAEVQQSLPFSDEGKIMEECRRSKAIREMLELETWTMSAIQGAREQFNEVCQLSEMERQGHAQENGERGLYEEPSYDPITVNHPDDVSPIGW